jgi:hypothetical protein
VLTNNSIGDEGAAAMVDALKVNTVLTKLYLHHLNQVSKTQRKLVDELLGRNKRIRCLFFFDARQMLLLALCSDELGVVWLYVVAHSDTDGVEKPGDITATRAEFAGVIEERRSRAAAFQSSTSPPPPLSVISSPSLTSTSFYFKLTPLPSDAVVGSADDGAFHFDLSESNFHMGAVTKALNDTSPPATSTTSLPFNITPVSVATDGADTALAGAFHFDVSFNASFHIGAVTKALDAVGCSDESDEPV